MTLEELYLSIPSDIDIDYFIFAHTESLSAPVGDRYVIAIDPTKVRSEADEKVKVAHEEGHCRTHSFYPPGADWLTRCRCENRAESHAIKKLVPKGELMAAFAAGCVEPWELSERFGVPEAFIRRAAAYYRTH